MAAGDSRSWPFRAILPWGESISNWHAWGAQMPSALVAASTALREEDLLGPAIGDAAGFTPLFSAWARWTTALAGRRAFLQLQVLCCP
jgi:hypothetical protein